MRVYEELFVVKPDAPTEEVDAYIGQVKELITHAGGTIEKEENWGKRKLAYRVQKYAEGGYVLLQFTAEPETIHEVERRMRVTDMVIKFITVRIDEKMKKIEKRRKHRQKRAARKPPPPVAAPLAPSAPTMPAEPAAATPGAPMPSAPAAPVAVEEVTEGKE
jgi:small subunit ribosomal protein S6